MPTFSLRNKIEAIGGLAGGVAHDFNNLLSVILSYTEFALEGLPEGDPIRSDLLEVKKAGERAVALTRQLLAFSRKQVLRPVPLDLNQIVTGVEKMLRRILGEDIELVEVLAADLDVVMADPSQCELVLLNLVVNARDAMPSGGRLAIETSNVQVDMQTMQQLMVPPGDYVQVSVSDTGCGMDEKTKARLFEPFFTTKEKGKGTGLGLSTAYGIVSQSGGNIWVHSEPGQGTTFNILLPRDPTVTVPADRPQVCSRMVAGTETILLVEDEAALLKVVQRTLVEAGYTLLTASYGDAALEISARHAGEIQLLLTDVIMPRMSGKTLADELARVRPTVKVLFMSGYTDNVIARHGALEPGTFFLPKPFTAVDLLGTVCRVLDGGLPLDPGGH